MELLKVRQTPDYLLYRHFLDKFDRLVDGYGRENMSRDLRELDRVSREKQRECSFYQVDGRENERLPVLHNDQVGVGCCCGVVGVVVPGV